MARSMFDGNPSDPNLIRDAARSKTPARHPFTGSKLGNGPGKTDPKAVQSMQNRWRGARATRNIADFPGVERNPNPKAEYVKEGRDLVDRLGASRVPKGLTFQDPKTGEVLKGGRRLPDGLKVQATRSGQVRVVRDGSVPVKVLKSAFSGPGGKFAEASGFRIKDRERFEKAVQKQADEFVPGGEASSRQVQILLDAARDDLLNG